MTKRKDYYDDKLERSVYSYKACGLCFVAIVLLLLFSLFFSGCTTTKYVTVPEYHTDTLKVIQQQRDSIWKHDSIFINQWQKGDTVFVESSKWHTKYVEKIVNDTVYCSRIDSVAKPYPIVKEVPAKLSWWQKGLMWCGVILIGLIVYLVIYVIKSKRYGRY